MIKNNIYIVLLITGLISCSPDGEQGDKQVNTEFDMLCNQFGALVEVDDYTSMNSEERASYFDQMLKDKLSSVGNAYMAWAAIRNATPDARSALFDEAARSVGYEEWECLVIKQHAHEVGSAFD